MIIELAEAVLCVNCDGISDSKGKCPRCDSAAILSLAKVLNRDSEMSELRNLVDEVFARHGYEI